MFLLPLLCDSSVGAEEEVGGNRQRLHRHARDPAAGGLERRIEELEKVRVMVSRGEVVFMELKP